MGNNISPTIFYNACKQGDLTTARKILQHVSPTVKERLFAYRVEQAPMISTPLFIAIEHHHLPIVQLLLENGINPNSTCKTFGRSSCTTALNHAISWRNATIVDILLRYGADTELIDHQRKTALHRACSLRDSSLKDMSTIVEIVDVLLKHRADLETIDKNDNLPLHWACTSGNLALVQYLLQEHCDTTLRQLDRPNKLAKTPLMVACEHNHVAITQELLTHGANPFLALSVLVASSSFTSSGSATSDGKKSDGKGHKKTALCWAVENGHHEIVQLLLTHHRSMLSSTTAPSSMSVLKEKSSTKPRENELLIDFSTFGSAEPQRTSFLEENDGLTDHQSATDRSSMNVLHQNHIDFTLLHEDDDAIEDHVRNDDNIGHLVGCCLFEAILLNQVKIVELLLDHVYWCTTASSSCHFDNISREKMFIRGLSLACERRQREMVLMMMRQRQTAGYQRDCSPANDKHLVDTLMKSAEYDPVIVTCLQQSLI